MYLNPFRQLPEPECDEIEREFLEAFARCADMDEDAGQPAERRAFEQLKAIYRTASAAQDDRCPTFFEAMEWAAWRLYGPGRRPPASAALA